MLLLIFAGLISGAALAYVYREQVDEHVREGIIDGMEQYLNNSLLASQVDFMQSSVSYLFLMRVTEKILKLICLETVIVSFVTLFLQLKCCGNSSYADWEITPWYQSQNKTTLYPTSCCKEGKCDYEHVPLNNTQLYQQVMYTLNVNDTLSFLLAYYTTNAILSSRVATQNLRINSTWTWASFLEWEEYLLLSR